MNTSIVGTIESISTCENHDNDSLSYFINLYGGMDLFITTNTEIFPDGKKLKEGDKYLFIGDLTCWSPRIYAQEIFYNLSRGNKRKIEDNMISVQGEISDVEFWKGHRGRLESVTFKLLHTECMATVGVVINLAPYLSKIFKAKYKTNNKITVVGKFETQEPQFDIKSATLCM